FSRDWSSDVCSSDLTSRLCGNRGYRFCRLPKTNTKRSSVCPNRRIMPKEAVAFYDELLADAELADSSVKMLDEGLAGSKLIFGEIGRASCRESVKTS